MNAVLQSKDEAKGSQFISGLLMKTLQEGVNGRISTCDG